MTNKEAFCEWAEKFLVHRDAVTHTLQHIEKGAGGFDLKAVHSTKEVFVLVEPYLRTFPEMLPKITADKDIVIFTFNAKENLDVIIDSWKKLLDKPKLLIYFVNLRTTGEGYWALKPYIHHMVSDDRALKTGLYSLFATVEPVA